MKKNILIALAGILILLVITNPSLRDFKDSGHQYGFKKSNWLIFSIFISSEGDTKGKYIGICKNFFKTETYYNKPVLTEFK